VNVPKITVIVLKAFLARFSERDEEPFKLLNNKRLKELERDKYEELHVFVLDLSKGKARSSANHAFKCLIDRAKGVALSLLIYLLGVKYFKKINFLFFSQASPHIVVRYHSTYVFSSHQNESSGYRGVPFNLHLL